MAIRGNATRPVSRLQHVNDPDPNVFKNPLQLEYIRTLVDVLRRLDTDMVSTNTASPSVLLASPNGTVFRVTVADDGTLTAVNARG